MKRQAVINKLVPGGAAASTVLTPTHLCCGHGEPDLSGQIFQNRVWTRLWGHPGGLTQSHCKPLFAVALNILIHMYVLIGLNVLIHIHPRISEFSLGNSQHSLENDTKWHLCSQIQKHVKLLQQQEICRKTGSQEKNQNKNRNC